jgi:Pilus assembly protein, PilP
MQSNFNQSRISCVASDAVWRLGGALVCAAYLGLAACSGTDDDLSRFIAQTKNEPAGPVKPLREIKPAESFVYNAQNLRSPFVPSSAADQPRGGPRYALDALKIPYDLNVRPIPLATTPRPPLITTSNR